MPSHQKVCYWCHSRFQSEMKTRWNIFPFAYRPKISITVFFVSFLFEISLSYAYQFSFNERKNEAKERSNRSVLLSPCRLCLRTVSSPMWVVYKEMKWELSPEYSLPTFFYFPFSVSSITASFCYKFTSHLGIKSRLTITTKTQIRPC